MEATPPAEDPPRRRRPTATSNFGVGKREGHDSSDFYARFAAPVISEDAEVNAPGPVDWIHCGDAREIPERMQPKSVALVVTSPPYFAGKEYEEALGHGHIPSSYVDYLGMLRDVFAACTEVLQPGGRIAVNVANLGRKPYRSLSADVIRILQDDLGLLLRGEIVWRKAVGAGGNCAWGSFQSSSNPSLRDLTERVVVASKGRFDRAVPTPKQHDRNRPGANTIMKDDFMAWTNDVWDLPPQSATRIGHPAPFPIELPQRLIELYTYAGELVLDPFMGSGSSAIAAVRTHRHYAGFDTDPAYVKLARQRVTDALSAMDATPDDPSRIRMTGASSPGRSVDPLVRQAIDEGWKATDLASAMVSAAGFEVLTTKRSERLRRGIEVTLAATDAAGRRWLFDMAGTLSRHTERRGLRDSDLAWQSFGKAAALAHTEPEPSPFVLLTTALPVKSSATGAALEALCGPSKPIFDVIDVLSTDATAQLARYASEGTSAVPPGSPWRR